jgi:predicted ATP-grasp superfamily ATP-dependent carboligase
MGRDPAGFLEFICELIERRRIDVIFPTHEQAYLLAAGRSRLPQHAAVALASFASFERVQGKAAFSLLLAELGLPQPSTRIVSSACELAACEIAPAFVKTSVGTASRGIWKVPQRAAYGQIADELAALDAFEDGVVVQEVAAGPLERAQAVFSHGGLVAVHAYRQIAVGAGGGDAIKESVRHDAVREHLSLVGRTLAWHGALSVDYVVGRNGGPLYIDCNPRLVEPVNAMLAAPISRSRCSTSRSPARPQARWNPARACAPTWACRH